MAIPAASYMRVTRAAGAERCRPRLHGFVGGEATELVMIGKADQLSLLEIGRSLGVIGMIHQEDPPSGHMGHNWRWCQAEGLQHIAGFGIDWPLSHRLGRYPCAVLR